MHNPPEERSPANSSSAYSTGRSLSGEDTGDQSTPLLLYREIRKPGRRGGSRAVVQVSERNLHSRRKQSTEMNHTVTDQEHMALMQNEKASNFWMTLKSIPPSSQGSSEQSQGDADDGSDLESNVSRLCQYLSGSEIDDQDICLANHTGSVPRYKSRQSKSTSGFNPSARKSRPESYAEGVSTSSATFGSTTGSSAEDCALPQGTMADQPTELHSYQRRMGKPTLPQDFLSCIPPPSHPPEASPTLDRPLPPQRQLPPVPSPPPVEDSHYDEARPPPPAPRPSKMRGQVIPPPVDGYELSASRMALLNNSGIANPVTPEHNHHRIVGLDPSINDWDFQTTILEKNPETGSFYIPSGSGHTTMSSLSPQSRTNGHSHLDRNYTQLPSERTTVPVSVMAMHPEMTGAGTTGSTHSVTFLKRNGTSLAPAIPRKSSRSCVDKGSRFNYKCCAICTTAMLIFSMAVICYLLVSQIGSWNEGRVTYYPGPSVYGSDVSEDTPIQSISLRPLPETFDLGDPFVADLPPGVLAYSSFNLQRGSHVQFNMSIAPDAKMVIYGQETVKPTPTEHKFNKIILGSNLHMKDAGRMKRSLEYTRLQFLEKNLLSTSFVEYLSPGKWFLGFLNDDQDVQTVRFKAYPMHDHLQLAGCRYDCYGKGECRDSTCYCQPGYSGEYCQETMCPVLCSGNGILSGGRCHCHQGWKGPDCDIPGHVCLVPSCSGHGTCDPQGVCNCDSGWDGEFCQSKTCPDPHCNGHGVCYEGVCYCEFGWRGDKCDEAFTSEELCPLGMGEDNTRLQCSAHGFWDSASSSCTCDLGYSGRFCEEESCNLDCLHGSCTKGVCECRTGWTGSLCDSVSCQPGCEEHGLCINGTCKCDNGFYGDNCQLDGCPNMCSGRGQCKKMGDRFICLCSADASGDGCSISFELTCDDNIDNDKDNLTDCEDSECCMSAHCSSSNLCQTVPDPYQVLVSGQTIPAQAKFYGKTRFLLKPGSVQQYPDMNLFDHDRVSVIRGRIITSTGGYLTGVRVTDASNPLFGFTISRGGGLFDLMVNGGGSVTLQLMRRPLGTVRKTVQVPWNRIVYVGDIWMNSTLQPVIIASDSCIAARREHHLTPFIVPSWKLSQYSGPAVHAGGSILADSRSVYQTLDIPGTNGLYLTYHSSHAEGYKSSIWLSIVPHNMPEDLRLIKLQIDVEGVRFLNVMEAKPNLTYEFGWDKKNVYKQKVFGLTPALVSVGYIYKDCSEPMWERSEVRLNGFKSGSGTIANWNLNKHHHLDVLGGVLEKGDGSTVYMREESPLLVTTLGRWGSTSSIQRPLSCSMCNGDASRASLYHPIALAAARDASLYIGDFDLIRKLSANKTITTVLELSPADTTLTHPYHLATHPITGHLYISLPLRRQVWMVTSTSDDNAYNHRVVAGDGLPCRVGDDKNCGEGGPADMAHLSYPKGMAFDEDGTLYILDERRVLSMDSEGILRAVVGGRSKDSSSSSWSPSKCQTQQSMDEFSLFWPTHVAVDPLSQKLLILDADTVYSIHIQSGIVSMVLGSPSHCPQSESGSILQSAKSMAVDGRGRLFVAESDGRKLHRVRAFYLTRRNEANMANTPIPDFVVGANSKCDCDRTNCPCDDQDALYARDAHLHNPSALAVDESGTLHIADTANYKIKSVLPEMPKLNAEQRQYWILDPDSQEQYYFNRFGQHQATKNLLTDMFIYNFTYHIDTAYGKLIHLTAAGGHRLYFLRKSPNMVVIETAQNRKSTAHVSNFHGEQLDSFVGPDNSRTQFIYDTSVGLLTSRINPDTRTWQYTYDYAGHVTNSIGPTGTVTNLQVRINSAAIVAKVSVHGKYTTTLSAAQNQLALKGMIERSIFSFSDGRTFHLDNADGSKAQFDSISTSLMLPHQTAVLRQKVQLPGSSRDDSDGLTSKLEWRYYLRREGESRSHKRVVQVGRKTRVNGVNVLTIEYDRSDNRDNIINHAGSNILAVQYNSAGEILSVTPSSASDLSPYNASYDTLGRLKGSSWGQAHTSYKYDQHSRIASVMRGRREIKFTYKQEQQELPSTVVLSSDAQYTNVWDEEGRLQNVVTPEGFQYTFTSLQDFAYTLSLYTLPHMPLQQMPITIGRNDEGHVTLVLLPDGYRRISIERDEMSKAMTYKHDGRSTYMYYYTGTQHLRSVTSKSCEDHVWSRSISRVGGLPVEVYENRHHLASSPSSAHFRLAYDDILRLTSLQASFNSEKTLEPIVMAYDQNSGRLDRYKDYNIQYSGAKVRLLNDKAVLEIVSNGRRLISSVKLSLRGRKCSEVSITYNAWDEVTSISSTVLSEIQPTVKVTYNDDGMVNLYQLEDSMEHTWQMEYSKDGRVTKINEDQIIYSKGVVEKFGDIEYTSDASGFITKRGLEYFEYDSYGRMTMAIQEGVYHNSYTYDENHRLITIIPSDGIAVNLFYGHPTKLSMLTHSVRGDSVTVYHYDMNEKLFAVEKDSTLFYVSTIANGSPINVFTDDGTLSKSIIRGPFGQIVRDSKRDMSLIIGWNGYIQDEDTGIVFIDGRPFDTVIGRFMSIRPSDWPEFDPFNPQFVDPFIWRPQQLIRKNRDDVFLWLHDVGIEVGALIPLLSSQTLTSDLCNSASVNLGAECHFYNRNMHFHKFLTVTRSGLLPVDPGSFNPNVHFTPSPSVYGGVGAVLSNYSNTAVLNLGQPDIQRMNLEEGVVILLNQSQILPIFALGTASDLSYSNPPKIITHIFCKSGSVKDELGELQINLELGQQVELSPTLNISLGLEDNMDYVHIWSQYSALRIYYHSDCQEVYESAHKTLASKAVQTFWNWEDLKVRARLPSSKSLTKEQEDLIENTERKGTLVELCEGQSDLDPAALRAIQR